VPLITVLFGILLVPVGLYSYTAGYEAAIAKHGHPPYTALIATGLGALLIVLGALSYKPNLRKHTMHAAAGVGLVGVIGAGLRAVPGLIKYLSGEGVESVPALVGTSLTMFLCLVFLGLCINSFIQARLRRQASQPPN
jgi:hypothetical protein